jgi:YD repeat-containing protein
MGEDKTMLKHARIYASFLLALCCLWPSASRAQAYLTQIGNTPFSTRTPVEMGYHDASTGNLHIEVPLGTWPARGSHSFTAALVYDSRIWFIGTPGGTKTWQPTNLPVSNWAGWRLVTNPALGGGTNYTTQILSCSCPEPPCHNTPKYYIYSNFTWTDPYGTVRTFPMSTEYDPHNCDSNDPTASALANDSSGYLMSVTNYTQISYVKAPDGTTVFPGFEDTNGNYFSTDSGGNVIDTLGRTPVKVTTNCNGNSALICYDVLNSQGSTSRYTVTTETINVHTNFGQSGVTEYSGSLTAVQTIMLPDNTTFSFTYDSGTTAGYYGLLTGMTLPTQGQITYAFTTYTDIFANRNRWLNLRTTPDGAWVYTPSTLSSCPSGWTFCQQVQITKPSNDNAVYQFGSTSGNIGSWATNVNYYNGSAIPANKVLALSQTFTSGQTDVQKLSQTTTTDTGLNRTIQNIYLSNSGPQISKISEWKFYSGSLPSTPDRITNYSGYCGVSPGSITVTDGSGTVTVAKTAITYDSYGSNGLTAVNGTSNHDDSNYGTGFTARCNPTSIARLVSGTTYLTNSLTYDTTGQILTSMDPAGNQTGFSYADSFYKDIGDGSQPQSYSPANPTNAYLTQITSAAVAAGNLLTKIGYYWGTGKMALTTDPNNQTGTSHFYDSLDRRTSSQLPNGGWTGLNYASSDKQVDSYIGITTAFATPWTSCSSCRHNRVSLDSQGRLLHSYLMSDPDGQTEVDAAYDANGRTQSFSNPYRSTSDPTYGLETPSYDGVDRVTQIKHADSNIAKTYYGASVGNNGGASSQLCSSSTYGLGYPTLFVDEIGNKRQTWTDGLGRTIEADEPNSSGTLSVNTCYAFDLNNNATGVLSAGGSQLICNSSTFSRCFSYDLLSRPTAVTTPEGGTVNYNYDSGGHLISIVEPAPNQTGSNTVTITFGFDALNRVTSKTYSDTTPTVKYGYDSSSLTGCTTAPPTITITNGKGHRTAMCDSSGAAAWSYDAAGNIVTEGRTIAGQTKTISYAYNLDGSLKTLTYPSGRVVTYTTGNAERPTAAVDSTNNINYVTTASGIATFAPPGGLANIVHGFVSGGFAGITESYTYNNRLQFASIQANSSAQLALSLSFSYAQPTYNNGNPTTQTNGVDSGRTQTYLYDNLNRILTAQSSASSGADCWGLTFGSISGVADDALGNLTNSTVSKCSAWSLSVGVNSHNQIITPSGYSYDAAGNSIADGAYTYTFDAENRIITSSGMSGGPYCYTYDGSGVRVAKSNANGGSCTGSPTVDVLYWRAPWGDTIAETDGTGSTSNSNYHEYVFFAGRRIARSDPSSGNVYYYFADQLGTTRSVTQANGTICFAADYYPYGEEVDYTTSCPQNYKFTG